MAEFELHIMGLTGPLCVIHAEEDWHLLDLHKAVSDSAAIPADQQRLIFGATILQGRSQLLTELLPRGVNEILCVRSKQWIEVPYYSGTALNDLVLSHGQESAPEDCKTIDEAKARCHENDELWGFTLYSDGSTAGCLKGLRFKKIGSHLGRSNPSGTTFVKISSAGRAVLLSAIRSAGCGRIPRKVVESITDLDTILAAVQENARVFQWVCSDLRCNTQVAEIAVLANPFALGHAPDAVKDNVELVRNAIEKNAFALQHASERLKSNREIVLLAISHEPSTIRYASTALQADPDICLTAVRKDGNILRHLSAVSRDNQRIVMAAVQQAGQALCFASQRLRANAEVVAVAVQSDPTAAEHELSGSSSL